MMQAKLRNGGRVGRLYEEPYADMREAYDSIKQTHRKLRWELSQVDKQISALYHELEKTDLTESLAGQYSVALQNLLRKRRVIKNEFIPIEIIRNTFKESFERSHEALLRNRDKSEEICESLKVSLTIDEVINL